MHTHIGGHCRVLEECSAELQKALAEVEHKEKVSSSAILRLLNLLPLLLASAGAASRF